VSTASVQLDAGGLAVLPSARAAHQDADAIEQVVARTYRHPALGGRAVIRLASDRLGQAEDLAMEFLGFTAPEVSPPIALQQRRSLGFAAWALINDPANARYALDLVKRMKAAARQARSKPGHAWDAFTAMARDLGRSARHFLPPFWEEVGRTFKDLGNQTYAGRALNKSLEAERVHALESDRARRRDVVLEFVLAGCLAGNALSEYGSDLQQHYSPEEAFAIFRDLCVRRTRGGMPPWATLPSDFTRLAKAAGLDGDQELDKWLEEVIDAPAMGRSPQQFWKTCSSNCKRLVARNPGFAVALLRHTRPEPRYYGESKLGPWLELLEEWGALDYLWEDEHQGAPPLGEPIAHWFGRIVRDESPVSKRTLGMLEKLAPRLRNEKTPLPLAVAQRFRANAIDIDVLEACLALAIQVDDPPQGFSVTFDGWLTASVDHPGRNQDIALSWKDERFKAVIFEALDGALACRGGTLNRGWRQASLEQRPFPLAAADRPGITELWRLHTAAVIADLEHSGLASFETARSRLETTLWPDTLRLFPDLADRLHGIDTLAMLQRTLHAGVFDEYGWPALEEAVDKWKLNVHRSFRYGDTNIHLTFPRVVVVDTVHALVIGGDGQITRHELRLPKHGSINAIIAIGNDLAVSYRDNKYQGHIYWVSDPAQHFDADAYYYSGSTSPSATVLKDGGFFLGQQAVRPGDKQIPQSHPYFHDGERFWRLTTEFDHATAENHCKIHEVDPQTGKRVRDSVPPWFEETEGGTVAFEHSELMPAPAGAENSPLGVKDGMLGWKTVRRGDGTVFGVGIDGRRWDKPGPMVPAGLLRQPGTNAYLPVIATGTGRSGHYALCDPSGSTIIAQLQEFASDYAYGQVTLLPLLYWHLLKVRDEPSSQKLRRLDPGECTALLKAAAADREQQTGKLRGRSTEATENRLPNLLSAVKKLLPTAPDRMAAGIAQLIERADAAIAAFTTLRDKTSADSQKESGSRTLAASRKSDSAAAHWGLQPFHTHGDPRGASVSEHLAAAAQFLKGNSRPGDLPPTNYLWFPMLEGLPLRSWQTYWRATAAKMNQKDSCDVPWLEFLKLWHELGIAQLPGQLDLMEGHPEAAKKNTWGGYDVQARGGKSFTLQSGDDRFIVVENDPYHYNQLPCHFLRYSTAKAPRGAPPGYVVKNVRKIKTRYDPSEMAAFMAAMESAAAPPLPSADELAEVARNLSASPEEIGLIWMGGLNLESQQSNFLPAELRNALGWKTTDASAARQALRNLNGAVLAHLYAAVVSQGCVAPLAAERRPLLQAIEKTWKTEMPRRLQLDAALQTRLSALGKTSRWHQLSHEELLGVAADPAKHPLLQPREIEIRGDRDGSYGSLQLAAKNSSELVVAGQSLRSIVQLVGLVHAETPSGHAARAAMPALIKQTTRLLDHASTVLELRTIYLYDAGRKKPLKPTEWIAKHLGKAKANAKQGTAYFDDGLIAAGALDSRLQALIAFRPAKLRDDHDLARLNGILGMDAGQEYAAGRVFIPVVTAIKSAGFQKLVKAILVKEVPHGQWPQNPHHTAAAIVKGIRKKLKLGEDAAVLYTQLLAVPDPTAANVCAWNAWPAAQLKQATAELIGRKLVLQATRARAGRSIFLPGEWVELKPPWLPIENWKLAHLIESDMNAGDPCPAGGPMVLRPFADLFAAAWQRVLDGDKPRYEAVKPKKKK
jgi:hypothetical protein